MILHSPTFPASGSTTSSMYRRKFLNSSSVGRKTGHVVSAICLSLLSLFFLTPKSEIHTAQQYYSTVVQSDGFRPACDAASASLLATYGTDREGPSNEVW